MRIYHGSEFIIDQPVFGKGKPYNDYGVGFYCTENIELAKEWSCDDHHDGFANEYELDTSNLKILYLNSPEYNILHWLTILVMHRSFRLNNQVAKDAKEYLISNFLIDISEYDVIIGYRADDSYFTFASDFLNNSISLNKLSKTTKLGNLGEQVVLISEKAFSQIQFIQAVPAERNKYYVLKIKRDKAARKEYLESDRNPSYSKNELYMIDLMRQEVKEDDPRLR